MVVQPNKQLQSWFTDIPNDTDFSLHNFPFGVFYIRHPHNDVDTTATASDNASDSDSAVSIRTKSQNEQQFEQQGCRCCSRIGDYIIDLSILEEAGLFDTLDTDTNQCIQLLQSNVFNQSTLNKFLEHPKSVWIAVRQRLMDLFTIKEEDDNDTSMDTNSMLRNNMILQKSVLIPIDDSVQLIVPIQIGDYTDFYSSREHATNVGTMFRGIDNALQPNWLHLPVGYHGRASSICITNTPIHRPCGQIEEDVVVSNNATTTSTTKQQPTSRYGPTQQLDFELEVAAVVGGTSNDRLGIPLTIEEAKDRIFGYVLMNDWSARDIQKWEYVPLGPFTSKNFATTISPWIVMIEAFDSTPTSYIEQNDPVPLPYLHDPTYSSYDISLSVSLQNSNQIESCTICETNLKHLYWNSAQQLTHHTVSGCVMKAGDLLGSGTISGATEKSYGSMLELSWKGTKSVAIGNGNVRTFLLDGDTITMKGYCTKADGSRVGFGECKGTIFPPVNTNILRNETIMNDTTTNRYTDFTLYGYWRSSSTWRVRVALAAKSIPYKTISIDLSKEENKSQSYLEINPFGQVPLLECTCVVTGERVRLSQSLAIINFLDDAFPTKKSLIPNSNAVQKAAAIAIVEAINSGIQPWQNVFALEELAQQSDGKIQPLEVAQSVNAKGLQSVELLIQTYRSQTASAAGPFSIGSFAPTIVDAYLVPQIYNARRFGVNVDDTTFPTLTKIDYVCSNHPWFKVSHPDNQPDAVPFPIS